MTTKHEPTALIMVWLTLFAHVAFVVGMICSRSRAARVFGIGALPPALIGIIFAAKAILVQPSSWPSIRFDDLVRRSVTTYPLTLLDVRFRIGLLLVAGLVGGTVALLAAWLVQAPSQKPPA